MSIKVIKPGLNTTIQDGGREGYYHLGIPPSGALDQFSMKAANLLVGNKATEAVLECTLLGPELEFLNTTLIAACGAEMPPMLDGEVMPMNTTLKVQAGQTLSFGYPLKGARIYLAVAGGFNLEPTLGSRSTYILGNLGGMKGRTIQKDDLLTIGSPTEKVSKGRTIPKRFLRTIHKEATIRVVEGLYAHRLTLSSLSRFYQDEWLVGSEADRIGYRFKGGRSLEFQPRVQPFGAGSDPSNIVDACYPVGSIQVPSGKEPIVLLRDAVSGGGYATIGTVISSDLDLIGQMQPNYKARFEPVTIEMALQVRAETNLRLQQLYEHLML
ncbi:biotin-dependent carboxyltransferase family protein [Vibrio rhizosphaerae]|uniref:Biotin-dependent carboxyltransferase family protein n=1 Tax=Vibrio rhizosphaerae TaxID=398736 RepID=A0ABU4IYW4_9VIBR|nr:biotin-dependent carboxyltransferase family protein [Vibrio rhizosphaerae]MDW6094592.1 biotin-dependent carboxyltransferase family protein [Vibrio rhizosphaerae]